MQHVPKRLLVAIAVLGLLACENADSPATRAQGQALASAVFPLKKSSDGKYLTDSSSPPTPFFVTGFTPHTIVTDIDPGTNHSNYDLIFSTRASLGFNAAWVEALVNDYIYNYSTGCTFDGICPFTGTISTSDCTGYNKGTMAHCYDFRTVNPAYFARLDQVIDSAAANGIAVFLTPVDTGGWLYHLIANSAIDAAT